MMKKYVIGGWVRDVLMQRQPNDKDFVVVALIGEETFVELRAEDVCGIYGLCEEIQREKVSEARKVRYHLVLSRKADTQHLHLEIGCNAHVQEKTAFLCAVGVE